MLTTDARRRGAAAALAASPLLVGLLIDSYVPTVYVWGGGGVPPLPLFLAVIGLAALGERLFLDGSATP